MRTYIGLLIFLMLAYQPTFSQNLNLKPDGINGSVGAGFASFGVKAPNDMSISLEDGVYAAVSGEKGFGFMNLYLTFTLSYLKTTGQSFYRYSSLTQTYSSGANLVNFDANFMQAGLGFRLKLLEESWFRPYLEGGGLGGYFNIKYKDLSTRLVLVPDQDYKKDDSLLDFGSYYEAGLEISFSDTFGIRVAARKTNNETKKLKTFNNQTLKYEGDVYYLSALKAF